MSQIPKNGMFYNNSNIKDKLLVLYDRLKRHLSSEYLELTEKKDNLENDVIQMTIELEKKDKTLFPNQERKDDRRYFTPLSIENQNKKEEDEKEKQLTSDIDRLRKEIESMNSRMSDITDFLKELEYINDYYKSFSYKDVYSDDHSDALIEGNDDNFVNKMNHGRRNLQFNDEEDLLDDSAVNDDTDYYVEYDNAQSYFSGRQIYPQMIRNLYDLSDYYQSTSPGLEVLIEYNDNNLELDPGDIRHILEQIVINIEHALNIYAVSMILIQGTVTSEVVNVSLNYICDDKAFDTVQITYNIVRAH